jgi:Polyketide cyclase / dehydrase and lipid transport
VSNANTYKEWGPWTDGGYRPAGAGPSQKGSIQWFRYGRRTTSVEEILEVEELRRIVYRVVRGLPVKNYRAEVTLTPAPLGGVSIHWAATWDNTLLGRVVRRSLRKIYPEVVEALVAAGNNRAGST